MFFSLIWNGVIFILFYTHELVHRIQHTAHSSDTNKLLLRRFHCVIKLGDIQKQAHVTQIKYSDGGYLLRRTCMCVRACVCARVCVKDHGRAVTKMCGSFKDYIQKYSCSCLCHESVLRGEGTAPLKLNRGTRQRWLVNYTALKFYLGDRTQVPIECGSG